MRLAKMILTKMFNKIEMHKKLFHENETLKNVKLTSEEREKVRELVEQGDTEGTQENIRKLLGELSAVEKRHRHDEKKLQKIASLYDTHNFWDT